MLLHFVQRERLTEPRNDFRWRDQSRGRSGHSSATAIAQRTDGEVIRAIANHKFGHFSHRKIVGSKHGAGSDERHSAFTRLRISYKAMANGTKGDLKLDSS